MMVFSDSERGEVWEDHVAFRNVLPQLTPRQRYL
jgi:hypothetical protein